MKIYEIGTGYTPIPATVAAATESVVEELTKAFIKQGVDCEIIDISASKRAPHNLPINEVAVMKMFTKSDVSLGVIHKVKRVVYSIALSGYLKKLLKTTKEKIVLHFHNQYNLFFFLKFVPQKLRDKAHIVYTNHNGMWSLPYEEVKDTLKKRYFQEIVAMKGADLVFLLKNEMIDSVVNHIGVPKEKVTVVKNGVNTDIYKPLSEDEVEAIKSKYKLNNKKIVLQVGSVYENKGQLRSLKMLTPLLKSNKDTVFAYVGGIVSQEYFDSIKAYAEQEGLQDQVVYLSQVSPGSEMNTIYNICDATVFVSLYEAFGLVIVEAIAAGKTTVLTSKPTFDLDTGYELSDENGFSDKVFDVINHKTVNNGRDEVVAKYSWDVIAKQHLDYFNKL